MARRKTGNPSGRYRNPANENVECQFGCGKKGRKGPIVAHERLYCPRRPGAKAPEQPPPAPEPQAPARAKARPDATASAMRVTRETVELAELPKFQG